VETIYASEEEKVILNSWTERIAELERVVIDHEQRFDTLQTPFWKRWWFWLQGWPWYDLNGEKKRRPWD
jgi:hypothetical protein